MLVAAFSFVRKVFTMKAFCEFLLGGVADLHHLAGEIQGLSGHRVVEIHGDAILPDFVDGPLHHVPAVAYHRNDLPYHEEVIADHSIYRERFLREVHEPALVECAVAFFRSKGEREGFTRLLAFNFAFEFREQHMGSVDVIQRTAFVSLVCKASVHNEFVGQGDHFVLFNFHIL